MTRITLELSEALLARANTVAQETGREVEAVVAEWAEQGASLPSIYPLEQDMNYPMVTPYGNELVAQELFEMLKASKTNEGKSD